MPRTQRKTGASRSPQPGTRQSGGTRSAAGGSHTTGGTRSAAGGSHTTGGTRSAAVRSHAPVSSTRNTRSSAATSRRSPARPAQQPPDWRTAVQAYVKLANEAELAYDVEPLKQWVKDEEHLQRLAQRLVRLQAREAMRRVQPVRQELRAELLQVQESAQEASVIVQLHTKRTGEHVQLPVEERKTRERLWLSRYGAQWVITRVEPFIAERRPRYGSAALQEAPWVEEAPLTESRTKPPRPFLNYEVLRDFTPRPSRIPYRRDLAAAYADLWWDQANSAYETFDVNCTNYVSQCLFAGNAPMHYTGRRESGWWYRGRDKGQEAWSYSWAVANAMHALFEGSCLHKQGLRAERKAEAAQLALGDVIVYDWDGNGRYQHTTIVTAFDEQGQPLVNANTVASRHRYWDYRDSYAWTEQTRYGFFHITDYF